MLFRACLMQYLAGLVFLLFPICGFTVSAIFEPEHAAYAHNALLLLSSMHSIAEYLGIIYFITPYRLFVVELFYRILPCAKREQKVS